MRSGRLVVTAWNVPNILKPSRERKLETERARDTERQIQTTRQSDRDGE